MKRIIRKKFKKFWKSVINRRLVKYTSRFGLVVFLLAAMLSFGKIQGTNSFFTDTATVEGNEFSAGYWIPTLHMTVSPETPDGDNGFYKTTPCVTLTADINGVAGGTTIYYKFSNDGDPVSGGIPYTTGTCVIIPDGNPTLFEAQAVNDENPTLWRSNIETGEFKVDTVALIADITSPIDGDAVSGTVPIRGTVTASNPQSYKLVIKNASNVEVYNSGDLSQSATFTNELLYSWDTIPVVEGYYTITLSAIDQLARTASDTITVKVNNTTVEKGDVVINEVMWMGSADIDNPTYDGPNDQWFEIKNISSKDLHMKDWYLTYKSDASNELKLYEVKDERVIHSGEYLLFTHLKENNSAIEVGASPDFTGVNNFDINNFQIKLYKDSTRALLVDTAGDGSGRPDAGGDDTNGDATNFYSMERNSTPGDGKNYDNWYTCKDSSSTGLYWKSGRTERGTPGNINLSKNDPTAPDYDPDFVEPVEKANPTMIPESNLLSPEISGAKMPTTLNIQ